MPLQTWGEFKRRIRHIEFIETQWGRRIGIWADGLMLVNKNVERRIMKLGKDWIDRIPEDWTIAYDGEWIYRISSPSYVDVPPSIIQGILSSYTPIRLGKWDNRIMKSEGATYASFTISFNKASHPRVGDYVNGLRITFGNDGYTAFRISRFIGILACENGLITGFNSFMRIFHAKYFDTVLERIRNTIVNFTRITDSIEDLEAPVSKSILELAFKKIDDFGNLWRLYSREYGESNLALAQALSWYTTHGGKTKARIAEKLLLKLAQA